MSLPSSAGNRERGRERKSGEGNCRQLLQLELATCDVRAHNQDSNMVCSAGHGHGSRTVDHGTRRDREETRKRRSEEGQACQCTVASGDWLPCAQPL